MNLKDMLSERSKSQKLAFTVHHSLKKTNCNDTELARIRDGGKGIVIKRYHYRKFWVLELFCISVLTEIT